MSMTLIINSAFSSSTVPEDWRTTLITLSLRMLPFKKVPTNFLHQCRLQLMQDPHISSSVASWQHHHSSWTTWLQMWLLMWNPTPWPNHKNQWTRAWLSGRETGRPCGLDFSKACFTRYPIMGSPVEQTHGPRASWEINKLSCWWYEVELCPMGLRGALRQCSWPRIVCPIHHWPASTAYLQTVCWLSVMTSWNCHHRDLHRLSTKSDPLGCHC